MWSPSKIAIALLAIGAAAAVFRFCPCCNKSNGAQIPVNEAPLVGGTAGPVTISKCASGPYNSLFSTTSVVYSGNWTKGQTVTLTSNGQGIKSGSYSSYKTDVTAPFGVKQSVTTQESMTFQAGVAWSNKKDTVADQTAPSGAYTAQVTYYSGTTIVECKFLSWRIS